jgi:hypothetical protein
MDWTKGMRRYEELNNSEIEKVIQQITVKMIRDIGDYGVPDCLKDYSFRILEIIEKAYELETPWFFEEMIWEEIENTPNMKEALFTFAKERAMGAYYAAEEDEVIRLS